MSSRPESKTGSQFVFLTMRLKDKLHPQRTRRSEQIKRTPSNRQKPADLKQDKSECVLAERQRAVISSLQYFKALVDRLGVDRPGVDKLVQDQCVVGRLLGGASCRVLEAVQTLVQNSSSASTCLYQSLAQLIRWTDQVVMQGVAHDNKESTASVTTVIRSVLDAVKDFLRLVAETQEGPAPPVRSVALDQQPTSDRIPPAGDEESRRMEGDGEKWVLAPPKPPIPLVHVTPPLGASPPALPPKQRLSTPGPVPCRVAIVAPMRRKPEAEQQESENDDHLKRFSSSSADSTLFEEDPDYDFLHRDLSSSKTLPPLPPTSSLPPALPEKRRRSAAGKTNSQTPPRFEFNSTHEQEDIDGPEKTPPTPLPPGNKPPPLPEKKRHIHQYLQVCSSYNAQSAAMFYHRPQHHSSKQREAEGAPPPDPGPPPPDPGAPPPDPGAPPDTDVPPSAPLLPPKKKQQDLAKEEQSKDSSQILQQDEQEEMVLTSQQEILARITMKSEDEEGPDVKAASPEILLVYATDSESISELILFREAFLSTYRSFIHPRDVISKLEHRYRRLREACEAATNTFQLLLRVVDGLCVTELDSDLLLLLMDLVSSLLIGGELEPAHLLHSSILSKVEQKWQRLGSPGSQRPLAARSVAARPGTLLDFRSQDLAEQLTLLDAELFYKIELPEVLLWSKEQNEEKSPNLTEFTQHFNSVSFWVRSVIILQDKPQEREKLLLKFLKVMKHLRKLNNFNSYLSILSALDSAPLRRLDWQKSTSEALEEFSSLIDSSSSFRAYRAALAEVEPPCIPYLGLILQDLTFVHLGNPDTLMTSQGSKVNFCKHWQQFNILDTLRSYQQIRFSLQPNDDIISFFNDFSDHLADEALWELSLRLRPRNTPRANQR